MITGARSCRAASAPRASAVTIATVSTSSPFGPLQVSAQNLVSELRATRLFPEMGATSGQARQGMQDFLWRQEVSATPNYSFRRVEIKVFLPDRPEYAVARQISYVARQQN